MIYDIVSDAASIHNAFIFIESFIPDICAFCLHSKFRSCNYFIHFSLVFFCHFGNSKTYHIGLQSQSLLLRLASYHELWLYDPILINFICSCFCCSYSPSVFKILIVILFLTIKLRIERLFLIFVKVFNHILFYELNVTT